MREKPQDSTCAFRGTGVAASLDVFEDREGSSWCFNAQTGWVRVPASSRPVVAARMMRVLLRAKRQHPAMAQSIARRLDGANGWWATATLKRGF